LEGPPAIKIKVEPKKPRKKKVYIDQTKLTMAHLMNNI